MGLAPVTANTDTAAALPQAAEVRVDGDRIGAPAYLIGDDGSFLVRGAVVAVTHGVDGHYASIADFGADRWSADSPGAWARVIPDLDDRTFCDRCGRDLKPEEIEAEVSYCADVILCRSGGLR